MTGIILIAIIGICFFFGGDFIDPSSGSPSDLNLPSEDLTGVDPSTDLPDEITELDSRMDDARIKRL